VTILAAATPPAWVDAAVHGWRELLVDHANCEKKAASSALALIFAYAEDSDMSTTLSRLAREELRHFEQVARMMRRLQVPFERQQPGRYASRLRAALRQHEPVRRLDLMCAYALIEARSAERFALLAERLRSPLNEFYASLHAAEERHFQLYVQLAEQAPGTGGAEAAQCRLAQLAQVEAALIVEPDVQLRFHSGSPASAARQAAQVETLLIPV
jgi:tRNA 2-(methylsulfanyl)-N6-isopentenyladenosine37 hydroxylase